MTSKNENDLRILNIKIINILGLLTLFGLLMGIAWKAANILLLIFAAILLAVILRTFGAWLSGKLHLSENLSTGLGIGIIAALTILLVFLAAPTLNQQAKQLSKTLPESLEQFQQQLMQNHWLNRSWDNLKDSQEKNPAPGLEALIEKSTSFLASFAEGLFAVLFISVVGIYLAIDPHPYWKGTVQLIPPAKRRRLEDMLRKIGNSLHWWTIGIFVDMIIVGILTILGLLLLQIPLAIFLGFIAGVLIFIPTFGPIIAAVPAVLIAFAQSPEKALYVAALYCGIQIMETYFLAPIIMRRTIHLPPVIILISQIILGLLFGFLGLALAIPILVVVSIAVKMLYQEDVVGLLDDKSP